MNTKKVAELNDKLRRNIFHSGKDKVVLTSGFSALPFDEQLRILIKVKEFKDFNKGNNPYGERDFGRIEHNGKDYFFKIDYIAPDAEEVCGRGVEFYKEASGGRTFKDDMNEIFEILKDAILIAHNLQFDENFISTEFWRQNILFKPHGRFCSMNYFKNVCNLVGKNGRIKNPKLSELIDFFNIDNEKVKLYCNQIFKSVDDNAFHDARYDTTALFIAFQVYSDKLNNTDAWTKVFVKNNIGG